MNTLVFGGIQGANPLGFLAALGAFRAADLMWPNSGVRMRWIPDGGWRPEVSGVPVNDAAEFCRVLHERGLWAPMDAFDAFGNNITVPRETFGRVAGEVAHAMSPADRRAADFAAAFGCEAAHDPDKGRVEYTDLCFITGSGHQHFLGTARGLMGQIQPEHLKEALFEPWRFADKGMSFRWDPEDAKEYALRWRDPSVGGVSSVWGANRLAFEALPLFPTAAMNGRLRTTGFRRVKRTHDFTWPIWTQPASLDAIRSLLACRALVEDKLDRVELKARGVEEVFRAQRVRIGQGANFKVSFRAARSA